MFAFLSANLYSIYNVLIKFYLLLKKTPNLLCFTENLLNVLMKTMFNNMIIILLLGID